MTFPLSLTIITLWGVCANLNLVFERVWGAPTKRDPEAEMVRWRNSEMAKFVAWGGPSGVAWWRSLWHGGELSVVAMWVWMARGTKIVCVVGLHDDDAGFNQ